MTLLRRFCLLMAIMFWQGGFTFYGAVVVPIGSEVLGSHQAQGFVTRSVTNYLNLAGLVAISLWLWDMVSARDSVLKRRRLSWALWLVLVLTLGLQEWLHVLMEQCLDIELQQILDKARLRYLHVWYLNISTIQWAANLLLIFLTLLAWRSEDSVRTKPDHDSQQAV
jgi:hypothetical protein